MYSLKTNKAIAKLVLLSFLSIFNLCVYAQEIIKNGNFEELHDERTNLVTDLRPRINYFKFAKNWYVHCGSSLRETCGDRITASQDNQQFVQSWVCSTDSSLWIGVSERRYYTDFPFDYCGSDGKQFIAVSGWIRGKSGAGVPQPIIYQSLNQELKKGDVLEYSFKHAPWLQAREKVELLLIKNNWDTWRIVESTVDGSGNSYGTALPWKKVSGSYTIKEDGVYNIGLRSTETAKGLSNCSFVGIGNLIDELSVKVSQNPNCTADKPNGTYPNCCPSDQFWNGNSCQNQVCPPEKPNGTYPNCCEIGKKWDSTKNECVGLAKTTIRTRRLY